MRLQSREGTRRINCSPNESLSTFFSKVRISSKCEGVLFVNEIKGLVTENCIKWKKLMALKQIEFYVAQTFNLFLNLFKRDTGLETVVKS